MLNTVRSWFNALPLKQERVVVAGVILFLVGWFIPVSMVKVLAFVLSGAAVAYRAVLWLRNDVPVEGEHAAEHPSITTEERDSEMKKLVFDDFQPGGKQYRVDFVEETRNQGPSPAPQRAEPERSIALSEYEFQLSDFVDVNEDLFVR